MDTDLFADDAFADLFTDVGRRSISPRIVAVVMALQRFNGMSDREAVDAFAFDLRWKYAAGALDFNHPGFVHTVLVDMRERLRRSERPNRIFDAVLDVAKAAGLVGTQARARLDGALRCGRDARHSDADSLGNPQLVARRRCAAWRQAARPPQTR